jgi:hypothetical protein
MGSPRAVLVPDGDEEADEPDEPDEPTAVVVVVVFVVAGTVACRGWKPRTAAVPKTVAAMTMGERLIGGGSSEGE